MKKRLLSVDALRGLAALVVVFYHAREMSWIGIGALWHANHLAPSLNAYLGYLTFPVIFGWAAVPLFFVLSGYCIHRPHVARLAQDENYRIDLKNYLVRRLWRIYPVLIAAIVFTWALDFYTAARFPADEKLGDGDFISALINALSLQGIAGPTYGSNLPLWTLGLEIHFYLVYPLLFWATRRFGPGRTVLAVAAISLVSLVLLQWAQIEMVIFLPFWFTWTVGFLVAEREVGRASFHWRAWRVPVMIALLAACALTLKQLSLWAEPLFAPAIGVLLAWSISARGEAFWSRRGDWLARVGAFSFSLYAFHYPFIVFLRSWWLGAKPSAALGVPIVITLLCVALGAAMFWLVERWSLRVPQGVQWKRGKRAFAWPSIQW